MGVREAWEADAPVRIFDPELASEISSQLLGEVANLRLLFAAEDLCDLNGLDLENLMRAAFMMGYAGCIADARLRESGVRPALHEWALKQALR